LLSVLCVTSPLLILQEEEDQEEEEVEVLVKKESSKAAQKKAEKPKPAPKEVKKSAPKPAKKAAPKAAAERNKPTEETEEETLGFEPDAAEGGAGPVVHLPLPRRRRSLPKNYSFNSSSLLDPLGGARSPSSEFAGTPARGSPTRMGTNTASPLTLTASPGAGTASPMPVERKAQLQEEFSAGLHRVPDPPSIRDEDDLRDRGHVKFVPIIPIEVKKYVTADPAVVAPSSKKKFTIPVEEVRLWYYFIGVVWNASGFYFPQL
jgi:hypothetical protein